uniref:Uncharacterized protein n=1 Tax=Castor canadensis TaxID=51338 RepID=A0A8C0X821_CASCN
MSEMAELLALYEECSDLQMDMMPGEGDLQMEAGIGSREPSLNPSRSGAAPQLEEECPVEEEAARPMAAPRGKRGLGNGPSPGEQPGPHLESEEEEFDDWEDDHDYPEEKPLRCGLLSLHHPGGSQQDVLRTSQAEELPWMAGFSCITGRPHLNSQLSSKSSFP